MLDYKQKIQIALIRKRKDRKWLVEQLQDRYGISASSATVSRAINGQGCEATRIAINELLKKELQKIEQEEKNNE